ncbi:TPA: helix-turn-helix domain-containing protein [Legionella pneumophila]|nr:helix-turn-helix domain-containing protein [Legionella pneumophila]HEM0340697.1 helix-turn-helix domain-containing protein [Legionella pneumophila]
MNIKKEIGKRILEARKAKGLTLKALGELAGGLKQTRLTNWEQGVRTPGPEEIKSLARALDVSPSYLMCLSDEIQIKKIKNPTHLIPLLTHNQAFDTQAYSDLIHNQDPSNLMFVSLSTVLLPELSNEAFALKIVDESMTPEIRVGDIIIIDPLALPKPGDYVVVKVKMQKEVILCQYKKLSYTSSEFELLTLNDTWPNINVSDCEAVEIIGVVVQNIRNYH